MNKYQKLASNTLVLGIGQFSSKLLVYVMLKFYLDTLGDEQFGVMNNIITAASLLISVVTLSIADGVLRFALEQSNNGKMVFSIGINVCIVGCIVFIPLVPLVGMIPMLKGYEWLILLYVFTGAVKEVCGIYVRSRYSVKLYAVDGIVTTVSTIVYNLIFLGALKWGVMGYVLAVVLGDFTSIIFLNVTTKLITQYRPFGNDRTLRNSMLRYSIPLMPTMIMWWIINASDQFMITGMLGDKENSLYSFAYKFPNLVTIVVGIFSQAWRMSAITERNSRTISNFYSTTFSMIQTVMFLGCGGIMLILRPIIMQFYDTEGFETGYFYVPLLLGATIFQAMDNFLASIYEASQKTTHSLTSSAIGAGVNVALNIILIKAIGIAGAAIATLASYIVVFAYRINDTKKYLYMKVYWAKIVVNFALLTGMACSIMFLEYGALQNVINAVIFLLIAAINFQSCVQAVKLVLNRRLGRSAPQTAPNEPQCTPPPNAPRSTPNNSQRREPQNTPRRTSNNPQRREPPTEQRSIPNNTRRREYFTNREPPRGQYRNEQYKDKRR